MAEKETERVPLYYTFGNHMHWVDMEWLWGYGVLEGSVRDMLDYCAASGAKGNINFDAAGYERLAVESPVAFSALRAAVRNDTVDIVGASYGQPYGLFHGGESNVRQRVWGVRSVARLFGVRPTTFWEEEFDFFPQLPQMLSKSGYTHGSLFFQWTWHTPTVPQEDVPAVRWRGIDGSELLAATKNRFSVHQWPEDLAEILDDPDIAERGAGLVQWLELMPSPDWMCRSELMLPLLNKLKEDPRFELRFRTLRSYLDEVGADAPVRDYQLNEVFHGMSLGKNGDLFRRLSRVTEGLLLNAETAATVAGCFGRPYPHWDAYPTWELDEAWRELLLAQHHDNDECEGLCGFVGKRSYERALDFAQTVRDRSLNLLARRSGLEQAGPDSIFVWNQLGWSRSGTVVVDGHRYLTPRLPSAGYVVLSASQLIPDGATSVLHAEETVSLQGESGSVTVDAHTGQLVRMTAGAREIALPTGTFELRLGGLRQRPDSVEEVPAEAGQERKLRCHYRWADGYLDCMIALTESARGDAPAIEVSFESEQLPVLEPRYAGALTLTLPSAGHALHDHPYAVTGIEPTGSHTKKYPTGDWMTSEQEYEQIQNPVTSLSFYDLGLQVDGWDYPRLQVIHDGSQAGFLRDDELEIVLSMNDPWDEEYFVRSLSARFYMRFHSREDNAALRRHADELLHPTVALGPEALRPPETGSSFVPPFQEREYRIPQNWSLIDVDSDQVNITAIHRESNWVNLFPSYAGSNMGNPIVVRLVEFGGRAHRVELSVRGTVQQAFRTNLLGETDSTQDPPDVRLDSGQSVISIHLSAHEIATLYIDLAEAKPIPRNLDEHRERWAHAHRVPDEEAEER